ncbi:hypothetical protein Prudu_001770 [Prunus dulcis]|uniref:Uncharacterized protein n=1 Tax=Prunus dulcis TaxID=3755 RepID=A0A4Y1QP92_PRUDU|nr:hypothetical protein Prudu_001770 [Prunus dulcis]
MQMTPWLENPGSATARRACFPSHLPLPAPFSLRPPPQNIVHHPPAPSYPQVGPIFADSLDAGRTIRPAEFK